MRRAMIELFELHELPRDVRTKVLDDERQRIRENRGNLKYTEEIAHFVRVATLMGFSFDTPAKVFFRVERNRYKDGACFWARWSSADRKLVELYHLVRETKDADLQSVLELVSVVSYAIKERNILAVTMKADSDPHKFRAEVREVAFSTGTEFNFDYQFSDKLERDLTQLVSHANAYFYSILRNSYDLATSYEHIAKVFREQRREFLIDGTQWTRTEVDIS
jgi:hypothetical protein